MYRETADNWMRPGPGPVDRIEASFSTTQFSPHRHDTYAIGVTLEGVQRFDYRGATRNALPGNLVILHPDEMHDGRAGTDAGFRYRTIYIEPVLLQNVLHGAPLPFVEGGISCDPGVTRATHALLEDFSHALDPLEYEDAIYDLAIALDALCGMGPVKALSNARATEAARQLIHEHLDDGVTLDELEAATGHDRWALSRDFRSLYGTSPHRYLTLRRLDGARAMIRSGRSLAEAAVASGFSDQSHFTRQFRKTWGLTPKKWVNAQSFYNARA